MNHLGFVHILLLIGVGLSSGPAQAELTAYQNLIPTAEVGQMVTVTVSLTYNGLNSIQAVVTPSLPPGVVANAPGQSTELYPGITQQIRYPFAAQQSGTYWIVSEISYAEEGTWRNLQLEAPFTATASAVPEPQPGPGEITPDVGPDGPNPRGTDPFPAPPVGVPPGGVSPQPIQPSNETPGSGFPEDVPQDGFNPAHDQGERPPSGQ